MPMNRREFFFRGVGVATVSAMVPRFAVAGARFFEESLASEAAGRVLVVVELAGGNDGLNTVVPYTDSLYSGVVPIQYPKAGEENSAARIGMWPLREGPPRGLASKAIPATGKFGGLSPIITDAIKPQTIATTTIVATAMSASK